MNLSPKTTLVGFGLTAGSLLFINSQFESHEQERNEMAAKLMECRYDVGRTGCLEAIELADVKPEETIEGNDVTLTYSPDAIEEGAEDLIDDDETGLKLLLYPSALIIGLSITFGVQNEKINRNLIRPAARLELRSQKPSK